VRKVGPFLLIESTQKDYSSFEKLKSLSLLNRQNVQIKKCFTLLSVPRLIFSPPMITKAFLFKDRDIQLKQTQNSLENQRFSRCSYDIKYLSSSQNLEIILITSVSQNM
jgi:hypothetical protein